MYRPLALALLACATLLAIPVSSRGDGGDLLWQDQFDLAGGEDLASAVAAAGGRVVVVGGATNTAGNSDFLVRAYRADGGTLLWKALVNVAGGVESALAVVMDDQRVVVAGSTREEIFSNTPSALIRAYVAKTGALAWTDGWPGPFEIGLAMAGSRTVAAGRFVDVAGVEHLLVRAYVTKTGAIAWEALPQLPAGYSGANVHSRAVAVLGRRAFVAAMAVRDTSSFGSTCFVQAYDVMTGGLLWSAARDFNGYCRPFSLATDGRRVVIGGMGGVGGDDYVVQAYEAATGEFLWEDRPLGGILGTNVPFAIDMSGRQAFVAGWHAVTVEHPEGTKGHEAFVVRSYDIETGALRWEREHHSNRFGPFYWHGLDVEVATGRVFAVGQEVEGLGTWLVRAYDPRRGDVVWEDFFQPAGEGAEYGWRQALTVDGGRVFVAGSGRNAAGNVDFILRAYDAR